MGILSKLDVSMNISDLTQKVVQFRDDRDWKQFHNPKDLALSLMLEAAEVAEHFQWKNVEEMGRHIEDRKEDVSDELADVLYWVLLMANDMDIDISQALVEKIRKNNEKYPVEKATGKHTKYTEL